LWVFTTRFLSGIYKASIANGDMKNRIDSIVKDFIEKIGDLEL